MTLTLRLPRETETRLSARAAMHGVDVTTYASRLLDDALRQEQPVADTAVDEWERDLLRYIEALPRSSAPLPAEATHRASFYEDAA